MNNTFTMASTAPFSFPGSGDIPPFTAALNFSGHIVNQPPTAVAVPTVNVACDSPGSGTATLDGRGSHDPDQNGINASWLLGPEVVGTFVGHEPLITTPAPFVAPGPTTTYYTLQVADTAGQVDTTKVAVTVSDNAAPVITASVSPDCLWAPNHGLVLLELGSQIVATSQDACSATSPAVYILDVTSDQPELGGGQGSFAPDFLFGTGAVCLRSERQGTGKLGRTYTITLAAVDASGNQSTRELTVRVPHDQSGTKCPRTPPSLIVADGDPACTAALPGAPMATTMRVPETPSLGSPQVPSGCSSTGLGSLAAALVVLLRRRRPAR